MSDDIGRVRTLPPEPPEDSGSAGAEEVPGRRSSVRLQRAWLPLVALGLIGGVAIGLLAGGLGTAEIETTTTTTVQPGLVGDAASRAPQITTTTTLAPPPPPPLLSELIVGLEGKLLVTAVDAGGPYTASWLSGLTRPSRVVAPAAATEADYDVERRWIAYLGLHNGNTAVLFAGPSELLPASAQFAGVASFAWHDTEGATIAWTAVDPLRNVMVLARGRIVPGSLNIEEVELVTEVDPEAGLVAWGEWGFLVQEGDRLTRFDAGGNRTRAVRGRFLAASAVNTILVEAPPAAEDISDAPEVPVVDLANADQESGGVYVVDLDFVQAGDAFPVGRTYTLSPDGAWIVATVIPEAPGALRSQRLDSPGQRATSVPDARFLGWSDDAAYLLYAATDGTTLVVVDWQRGSQFRVPLQGHIVTAVLDND